MLNRIKQLELAASGLDPGADLRKQSTTQVNDYAESFLRDLPNMNGYEPDQGCSKLLEQAFLESPGDMPGLLALLDEAVNGEGINPASGGHMGYIPGGGIYPAALGDFLADVCFEHFL